MFLLIRAAVSMTYLPVIITSMSLSSQHRNLSRRAALAAIPSLAVVSNVLPPAIAVVEAADADQKSKPSPPSKFQRYPQIRFIAALGDPTAKEGFGADQWRLWKDDPGPRGVYLRNYESQIANNNKPDYGIAPAGWTFQKDDWWLEEHGILMSTPKSLPRKRYNSKTKETMPYKRYVVTGDREVTTILTVSEDGRWSLEKGSLYDVTHLPCRSARYTPPPPPQLLGNNNEETSSSVTSSCTPLNADKKMFPVKPGAVMPDIVGCNKQDYAVLFVLGEEV